MSKKEPKTAYERNLIATASKTLNEHAQSMGRCLTQLRDLSHDSNLSWEAVGPFLEKKHKSIHTQLREADKEGFQVVGQHAFDIWKSQGAHLNEYWRPRDRDLSPTESRELLRKAGHGIYTMSNAERQKVLRIWSKEIQNTLASDLWTGIEDAKAQMRAIGNVHEEVDRRVLQGADVIGITTSGLAKRISTLRRVHCKAAICEEAGEILEPHLLSALPPTVEHFIQIGDHEQLRPKNNNFKELSLESYRGSLYQLDRSQFERLSLGENGRARLPVAQLDVQRRMRLEISTLIRETVYPTLKDHDTTKNLPHVVGMRNSVFWLHHENLQDDRDLEPRPKSFSNSWEVTMVHGLVRHILRQGVYSSTDIAVITPYTGQIQKLRLALRNEFEIVLSDRDQEAMERDGILVHGESVD